MLPVSFVGKNVIVSGGSRGIGLAMAKRLAQEGANVAILAKTAQPHPKLPGTIYTAAEELERLNVKAVPIQCDIRSPEQIAAAVQEAVARLGSLDILINNASAIQLTGTLDTPSSKWDLMQTVCVRGTFLLTQACLPHLLRAPDPRILCISPPLSMDEHWFSGHVAYTIAKYGMSMCVRGWAGEFKDKIAVNALWPRTLVDTAALNAIGGRDGLGKHGRTVEIMADACFCVLSKPRAFTGHFLVDEDVLREDGVTDFSKYAVDPSKPLLDDLFISSKL